MIRARLAIFETNECFVITTQKVGTQFLRSFFRGKKSLTPDEKLWMSNGTCDFTICITEYPDKDIKYSQEEFEHPIPHPYTSTLHAFLNDIPINKDVIFLIRNPWERFTSAFFEDYIRLIFSKPNGVINTYIAKYLPDNPELYNWYIDNRDDIYHFYTGFVGNIELKAEIKNFLHKFVTNVIKSFLDDNGNPLKFNHNHPYLKLVEKLIHTKNKNNTIKVVDIDEVDLNIFFKQYKNDAKIVGRVNGSRHLKKLYSRIFNESKSVKEMFLKLSQEDLDAYNRIKEYIKNPARI